MSKQTIALVGAPTDIGAGHRGASMGPEALRVAMIGERLRRRGFDVTDRGNRRIQTFDTEGNRKAVWTLPTAPWALCLTSGPNQVMFVGETTFPGRIFKVALDGKVLGVIGKSGRELGELSGAHALACPTENLIYAAETADWRVQKLILHPAQ